MSRIILGVFLFSSFFLSPWSLLGQERAPVQKYEQKAGPWTVITEMEPVGNLQKRAISYRQRIFRQGPEEKAPQFLYEETTTGRVQTQLREDGLLLIQRVADHPAVVFPGEKKLVDLQLPVPKDLTLNTFGSTMNRAWFLDDGIFYHRVIYPVKIGTTTLLGFVRLDDQKKTIKESTICLEVRDNGKELQGPVTPLPVMLKMGDLVFWVNKGYHNVFYPDVVKGLWKPRKVRVLNLTTANLVEIEKVPAELIKSQIERILDFVEKQAHNQSPELECWAVKEIGKYGGPSEAARLKVLAGTIQETTSEIAPHELRTTDKVVKAAYAQALEAIEKSKGK